MKDMRGATYSSAQINEGQYDGCDDDETKMMVLMMMPIMMIMMMMRRRISIEIWTRIGT